MSSISDEAEGQELDGVQFAALEDSRWESLGVVEGVALWFDSSSSAPRAWLSSIAGICVGVFFAVGLDI